jgi:phosphoribosylformylglycinamidine (FGAM) synthase-like enzyme
MEFMVQVWLQLSFDEKIEEKKPTVQVGDPFTEKLLWKLV